MAVVEAVKLLDGPVLYKAEILGESFAGLRYKQHLIPVSSPYGAKLALPEHRSFVEVCLPLGLEFALSSSSQGMVLQVR